MILAVLHKLMAHELSSLITVDPEEKLRREIGVVVVDLGQNLF